MMPNPSLTTQAIKLISEGKDLVEVVIELDLPTNKVRDIYRQFLKLKDMHELIEGYDKTKLSALITGTI